MQFIYIQICYISIFVSTIINSKQHVQSYHPIFIFAFNSNYDFTISYLGVSVYEHIIFLYLFYDIFVFTETVKPSLVISILVHIVLLSL